MTAWNSTIRLQWWWELIESVSVESALFEQRRSAIALIPVPSRAIYVAICLTCFIYGRSAIIFTIFCVKKSILRVRDHSMTRRFQNSVTSFFHATRCFPLFILPICIAKPKTTLKVKNTPKTIFGDEKIRFGIWPGWQPWSTLVQILTNSCKVLCTELSLLVSLLLFWC